MRKLAILIPSYNESVIITQTLIKLKKIIDEKDIYVVDDGSSDDTTDKSKRIVKNVLSLSKNIGKANALNKAIDEFKLIKKYELIMPLDADCQIDKNFIKKMLDRFEQDNYESLKEGKDKAICVVGRVMSKRSNWISYFRTWEYEIAQTLHKNAEAKTNSIIVCPGCSTIYRSGIFKKVKIPTGTIAEDMDLTFTIYRKGLGRIIFLNSAEVLTQDPKNIKDLMKQLERWYTGFWQNVLKHNIPWGGQMLDFEVTLLATEGLFGGLVVLSLIFAVPFALSLNPQILIAPIIFDLILFVLPTLIFAALKNRTFKLFKYLPQFYIMRFIGSYIFLKSFFKVVFAFDLKAGWNKAVRYITTG